MTNKFAQVWAKKNKKKNRLINKRIAETVDNKQTKWLFE